MPYVPFHERFPEIAEKETRAITILNNPELASDTYGLTEAYCDELDCDCRRVFLNVISTNQKRLLATIAFGWEREKYYAKWLGENDLKMIKDLKGPVLNLTSPQSKLAPALLKQIKYILQDKNYIERLKRHYKLFKDEIKKEEKEKNRQGKSVDSNCNALSSLLKVGRNNPCPCGSGKKYKKCCLD
jgi:preprotein translocase subunit SecA